MIEISTPVNPSSGKSGSHNLLLEEGMEEGEQRFAASLKKELEALACHPDPETIASLLRYSRETPPSHLRTSTT